jgi:hypothetical protein
MDLGRARPKSRTSDGVCGLSGNFGWFGSSQYLMSNVFDGDVP